MLKTVVLLTIFVETFFFKIIWLIENLKQQKHLFVIKIFCIINVFTLTFDQFNAPLLNKSMN